MNAVSQNLPLSQSPNCGKLPTFCFVSGGFQAVATGRTWREALKSLLDSGADEGAPLSDKIQIFLLSEVTETEEAITCFFRKDGE